VSLFISALNMYVDGWMGGLGGRSCAFALRALCLYACFSVQSAGLTHIPGHHSGSMKPAHKDRVGLLLCLPSFRGLHKSGRCRHAGAVAARGESRPVKPNG